MDKTKLENLLNTDLQIGIDTIQITSEYLSDRPKAPYLHSKIDILPATKTLPVRYRYILNPNNTSAGEITKYSDFKKILNEILNDLGIQHYIFNRVDIRIDNPVNQTNINDYAEFLKFHKLMLIIASLQYGIDNRYHSDDFLTLEEKTLVIKSFNYEIEYYNKYLQEHENIRTRLELRSKNMKDSPDSCILNVLNEWERMIKELILGYDNAIATMNYHLIHKFNSLKKIKPNLFIRMFSDYFFNRKQLIDFLKSVGKDNPEAAANNLRRRCEIEDVTLVELKKYTKIVSNCIHAFTAF